LDYFFHFLSIFMSKNTNRNGDSKRNAPNPPKQRGPNPPKAKSFGRTAPVRTERAPVAAAKGTQSRAPQVTEIANGGIRVRHRELVSSVRSSELFDVASIALNPGLQASFPWLATIAEGYEMYKFAKLAYHYITRASTSTPGTLILAPEYDALEGLPADEITASSYAGATSDAPWKDFSMNLDARALHPGGVPKFVRLGNVADADLKTYDAGQLICCSTDGPPLDTSIAGKLWVDYEVVFTVPQRSRVDGVIQNPRVPAMAILKLHSDQAIVPGVKSGAWLRLANSAVVPVPYTNNIGAEEGPDVGSFSLPVGWYLLTGNIEYNTVGTLPGNGLPNADTFLMHQTFGDTNFVQVDTLIPYTHEVSSPTIQPGTTIDRACLAAQADHKGACGTAYIDWILRVDDRRSLWRLAFYAEHFAPVSKVDAGHSSFQIRPM
jgi:hypothetical protein